MTEARITHTAEHRQQIDRILTDYPGACIAGLPAAVRALWQDEGLDPDEVPAVHFVPDAFLIDHSAQEVVLFEVEVTHHLSTRKLSDLGNFWADFDGEDHTDWLPVLVQVDRFGNRTRRDLGVAYIEVSLIARLNTEAVA